MKRILVAAAALILLAPALAFAQRGLSPNMPNNAPTTKPATGARPVKPSPPSHHRPPAHHRPPHHRPPQVQPPNAGRPPTRPPIAGGPPAHHRPHYAQPYPPRRDQFYHRGNWFSRLVGSVFAYPRGWEYRRWTIGSRLPSVLYSPNYYYNGYAALGLEDPAPGYAWVRFGPDLLLVNLHTSEVEDVVYGVFE